MHRILKKLAVGLPSGNFLEISPPSCYNGNKMSGLSVNSISGSLAAAHRVQRTFASLANTMTQLSTGQRINSAKDDPAGLIAQELLRSEIAASNAAAKNTVLPQDC